jgi:hypothetical protein
MTQKEKLKGFNSDGSIDWGYEYPTVEDIRVEILVKAFGILRDQGIIKPSEQTKYFKALIGKKPKSTVDKLRTLFNIRE